MPTLVVPTRHGPMIVERHDKYVGRSLIELGEFCEGQVDLFRRLITKEMIVVDAGANIGALTIPLARMAGVVHAFEPQRHVYHMLCGNVAMNELTNVCCYNMALGAESGEADAPELDRQRENNLGAFSLDLPGEKTERVLVAPLTIQCNFLKIDVEGGESDVLKGAETMIRECEPIIYVENDRQPKADALIEQIRAMGYTPYWHVTLMQNPDNFNGNATDIFGRAASFDMVCTPPGQTMNGTEAKVGDFARMCAGAEHAAAA